MYISYISYIGRATRPPSLKRVKREPEIKQEPEPFTIRGYFGFDD